MVVISSKFEWGEKVVADGGDVVMTVIGLMVTTMGTQVQCSWFSGGSHYEFWFHEWRLAKKES